MNYRIFVEKKKEFDVLSARLVRELQAFSKVESLKVISIYDIFNLESSFYSNAQSILVDPVSDILHNELPVQDNQTYFAIEYHPGQYDQRADWAKQSIQLVTGQSKHQIRSATLYVCNHLEEKELQKVKKYLINTVDSQEKNLKILELPKIQKPNEVPIIKGFIDLDNDALHQFYTQWNFAFDFEDLQFIQNYFKTQKRNPTETELKVLDTYWSDHCRHTTFLTELEEIEFFGDMSAELQKVFQRYLEIRRDLNREKTPISLMDLGTIAAKYLQKKGKLTDVVISEEINACTVEVQIEVNGKAEDWYLLFKNETHNHPTEIEPFGGASTCVGGAIRDPLSGRAFVFQAMRITGSANPLEKIEDTLEGKLPQKKITQRAAQGFSSYGNQIGLATTHVHEIYDEGYKAKRMEVGFVAGAVPKDWVRREKPVKGDKVIVLGGKTGRDGVGGATGSSKVHTEESIQTMSAEVQKGDAVEERKIQRLFRNPKVTRLIKRCNDFGAGGVSVAIGEIADSLSIDLDKMPTKYAGLNGTELAISESQERMAVVLEDKDVNTFIEYASIENLQAVEVAEVTDSGRMQMFWRGEAIVDLERSFLNSSGTHKMQKVAVVSESENLKESLLPFNKENFKTILSQLNVCSQKGLIENFDSEVGRTSVLMPLGGKNLKTPGIASVQTFPVLHGETEDVSISTWGYSAKWANKNPFIMGHYAVIESVAKIVACGGSIKNIRLSFQEYFERLNKEDHKWGKPFQALLGALEAQFQFEIAAIGGKDSMSGTFKDLNVPPTLISFANAHGKGKNIISPEFKNEGNYIYIFHHQSFENCLPNYEQLIQGYAQVESGIEEKKIVSAFPVKEGGLATALFKMAVGNHLGFELNTELPLLNELDGSIVLESTEPLEDFVLLGKVLSDGEMIINHEKYTLYDFLRAWETPLESVFPSATLGFKMLLPLPEVHQESPKESKLTVDEVHVFQPIFPGTNCEYETQKVFEAAGAKVHSEVFLNRDEKQIERSLEHFIKHLEQSHILMLAGGFSAGDEPDGSAKFITAVLKNKKVTQALHHHLQKGGLILGICNGFQALVKSGLLPYGEIREVEENSPTLTYNRIGRHINQTARVKVVSDKSPWLKGMAGKEFIIPFSHGEGRFYATRTKVKELLENHQIATQYVDEQGRISENMPYNPNGSVFGIEGITDKSGQIYGRMGHPERFKKGLMKNIPNMEFMDIFKNGVEYLLKK